MRQRLARWFAWWMERNRAILPALFADAPKGEFSLTRKFDSANEQARLFGLRLDGVWMHVGTPDAVQAAERAFLASVA